MRLSLTEIGLPEMSPLKSSSAPRPPPGTPHKVRRASQLKASDPLPALTPQTTPKPAQVVIPSSAPVVARRSTSSPMAQKGPLHSSRLVTELGIRSGQARRQKPQPQQPQQHLQPVPHLISQDVSHKQDLKPGHGRLPAAGSSEWVDHTIPPSRIPLRYHVTLKSGLPPTGDPDALTATSFSDTDGMWHKTIFPSLRPTSRQEVFLLESWLNERLQEVASSSGEPLALIKEAQQVYALTFHELVRQASVHCVERGRLMARVWRKYVELFRRVLSLAHYDRAALVATVRGMHQQRVDALQRSHEEQVGRVHLEFTTEMSNLQSTKRELTAELEDLKSTLSAQETDLDHWVSSNNTLKGHVLRLEQDLSLQEDRYEELLQALKLATAARRRLSSTVPLASEVNPSTPTGGSANNNPQSQEDIDDGFNDDPVPEKGTLPNTVRRELLYEQLIVAVQELASTSDAHAPVHGPSNPALQSQTIQYVLPISSGSSANDSADPHKDRARSASSPSSLSSPSSPSSSSSPSPATPSSKSRLIEGLEAVEKILRSVNGMIQDVNAELLGEFRGKKLTSLSELQTVLHTMQDKLDSLTAPPPETVAVEVQATPEFQSSGPDSRETLSCLRCAAHHDHPWNSPEISARRGSGLMSHVSSLAMAARGSFSRQSISRGHAASPLGSTLSSNGAASLQPVRRNLSLSMDPTDTNSGNSVEDDRDNDDGTDLWADEDSEPSGPVDPQEEAARQAALIELNGPSGDDGMDSDNNSKTPDGNAGISEGISHTPLMLPSKSRTGLMAAASAVVLALSAGRKSRIDAMTTSQSGIPATRRSSSKSDLVPSEPEQAVTMAGAVHATMIPFSNPRKKRRDRTKARSVIPPRFANLMTTIPKGKSKAGRGKLKPLKWVLKVISQLYAEKVHADGVDDRERLQRTQLHDFVYEFYLHRYGLRSLAESSVLDLLTSVYGYRHQHLRVAMFARFLGMGSDDNEPEDGDDPLTYSLDALSFFLDALTLVKHQPLGMYTVNGLSYVAGSRAVEVIVNVFVGMHSTVLGHLLKAVSTCMEPVAADAPVYLDQESLMHIVSETQGIPLDDPTNPMDPMLVEVITQVADNMVDLDRFLLLMVDQFTMLSQEAEDRVRAVFLAADCNGDQTLSCTEFQRIMVHIDPHRSERETLRMYREALQYSQADELDQAAFMTVARNHGLMSWQPDSRRNIDKDPLQATMLLKVTWDRTEPRVAMAIDLLSQSAGGAERAQEASARLYDLKDLLNTEVTICVSVDESGKLKRLPRASVLWSQYRELLGDLADALRMDSHAHCTYCELAQWDLLQGLY